MDSGLSDLISKGGPGAIIACVVLALKFGLDGLKAWWTSRNAAEDQITMDSVAANATIADLLGMERKESERLRREIGKLRSDNDKLTNDNLRIRREADAEVSALKSDLQRVSIQLEGLQQRLRAGLPPA